MKLRKQDLVVGQRIKGYGLLNEYGEFEFTPAQTGSRQGQMKQVTAGDGYTINETRDKIIVHMNIEKKDSRLKTLVEFTIKINKVLDEFNRYEF